MCIQYLTVFSYLHCGPRSVYDWDTAVIHIKYETGFRAAGHFTQLHRSTVNTLMYEPVHRMHTSNRWLQFPDIFRTIDELCSIIRDAFLSALYVLSKRSRKLFSTASPQQVWHLEVNQVPLEGPYMSRSALTIWAETTAWDNWIFSPTSALFASLFSEPKFIHFSISFKFGPQLRP